MPISPEFSTMAWPDLLTTQVGSEQSRGLLTPKNRLNSQSHQRDLKTQFLPVPALVCPSFSSHPRTSQDQLHQPRQGPAQNGTVHHHRVCAFQTRRPQMAQCDSVRNHPQPLSGEPSDLPFRGPISTMFDACVQPSPVIPVECTCTLDTSRARLHPSYQVIVDGARGTSSTYALKIDYKPALDSFRFSRTSMSNPTFC